MIAALGDLDPAALAWLAPGELRAFPSEAWDEARSWVAGGG